MHVKHTLYRLVSNTCFRDEKLNRAALVGCAFMCVMTDALDARNPLDLKSCWSGRPLRLSLPTLGSRLVLRPALIACKNLAGIARASRGWCRSCRCWGGMPFSSTGSLPGAPASAGSSAPASTAALVVPAVIPSPPLLCVKPARASSAPSSLVLTSRPPVASCAGRRSKFWTMTLTHFVVSGSLAGLS